MALYIHLILLQAAAEPVCMCVQDYIYFPIWSLCYVHEGMCEGVQNLDVTPPQCMVLPTPVHGDTHLSARCYPPQCKVIPTSVQGVTHPSARCYPPQCKVLPTPVQGVTHHSARCYPP